MVEQLSIQEIGILLTGISISIAAFYYIMTLRNTYKMRQSQLIMSLNSTISSDIFMNSQNDVLFFQDFTSYKEWREKFSASVNPKANQALQRILFFYNMVGMLLKEKLIATNLIKDIMFWGAALVWWKCKPWIDAIRERYDYPDFMNYFEHLYNETLKLIPSLTIPEDLSIYEQIKPQE
jgi:hypothetical protein